MAISANFKNDFFAFMGQLKQSENKQARELGEEAEKKFDKAITDKEISRLFEEVETKLSKLGEQFQPIQASVRKLRDNLDKRIEELWGKRPYPEEEAEEIKRETQETAEPMEVEGAETKEEEQLSTLEPPTKKSRTDQKMQLPLHISELPQPGIERIVENLSPEEKLKFLISLEPKQTESAREYAINVLFGQASEIFSNPQAAQLYESVYGRQPPQLNEMLIELKKAVTESDAKALARVNARLGQAYREMQSLIKAWENVPDSVKQAFGNVDSSKIFTDEPFAKLAEFRKLKSVQQKNLCFF